MPKVSKATATLHQEIPIGEIHEGNAAGYEISFLSFHDQGDLAPLLKGLPDDKCICPHWGYVTSGRVSFTFNDRVETFEAGDAFYVEPGHTPLVEAGTEVLFFSPEAESAVVNAAIERNMDAEVAERILASFPPVEHPLVRLMPYGRKALYVGGHCVGVKGMDEAEGMALIEQLYAHATQDKYIYRHHWKRWDLVIWDNRCTMHAATPLLSNDYRRDMRRTTINESGPETSAYQWMGLDEAA